ncbi:hypothetical protein RQP46_009473 [Phenoliferia psychrophenolica]
MLVQPSFAVRFNELENLDFVTGVVSIYHAGGLFGVIAASYVADAYGRKVVFLFNCGWATLGAVLMTIGTNLGMMFAGRLFSGFAAYGFIFCTVLYIMEIAPASSRGLLGVSNGIVLEIGFILMGWQSYGLQDWAVVGNEWSWRIPCIEQLLPVVMILAGYPFVPESPRWLASKGRNEEALQVLLEVHKSPKDPSSMLARSEHHQIVLQCAMDKKLPFTLYKKRTWCAILIEFAYLLAGDFFISTYGPQLLNAFGFTTKKSLLYQGAWLTLLFINVLVAPFCDKIGRKPLLVYMVFCSVSEPPAYLMACEVFPLHVRGKGIALAYGTLAITNTWVIEAAATMTERLGWKAYLLFICFSLVNVTLFMIFVPETANVPLEEMARIFGDHDQVAIHATDIHLENEKAGA